MKNDIKTRFSQCVRDILDAKYDHECIEIRQGLFITVEYAEEEGERYVFCYLTNRVDREGYCLGDIFADCYIDNDSTEEQIEQDVTYLIECSNEPLETEE